jgi:ParB-like chromosome segregation protein Spo0J
MARAGRKPKGGNGVAAAAAERVVWKGPPWLQAHLVPLDSIFEDLANLNTHDEDSIAGLAAAYDRYGQQKNLVIDAEGVVKAGNGQLIAARRLGWTHIAVGASDLTGSDLVGYAIADNELPRRAAFDQTRLLEALRSLQSEDYPVHDTGFDADRIDDLANQLAQARLEASPDDQGAVSPPDEFPAHDESIETAYCCPRCGYAWSGNPGQRVDREHEPERLPDG